MNTRKMLLLSFALFVTFASSGCGYNTLQTKQQNVRGKWSGVENQLQRRADLIPNLVSAAQSAGVQEQEVFGQIAERVARRLSEQSGQGERLQRNYSGNGEASDLAALQANLFEIKQRLAHIESHIKHDESCEGENQHRSNEEMLYRSPQQQQPPAKQSDEASKFATRTPSLSGTYYSAVHPSEERFQIGEAVAELVDYFENEKTCDLEPGGKPCDHCAMCSSRGL